MADLNISQTEADNLIAMPKLKINDDRHDYPTPGLSLSIPLVSEDRKENFVLDIGRGRINLQKGTYQNRSRQVLVLVRLDFGGSPHRNPDGEEIACPHLHIYREGYGHKWAVPAPAKIFKDTKSL